MSVFKYYKVQDLSFRRETFYYNIFEDNKYIARAFNKATAERICNALKEREKQLQKEINEEDPFHLEVQDGK